MGSDYFPDMSGNGPYRGNNPQAREAAGIMNHLYSRWTRRPRVEGLMWILGRREMWAIRQLEPGAIGVEYDLRTLEVKLFGLPVHQCNRESECMLVIEAKKEVR